jgi:hypothetical protein
VQTFHEPPSLRPRCSSLSAIGHPELGLNSTRQGNSRLGKENKEVAQKQQEGSFIPGATYAHNSQTLIPHMPAPPQESTPSLLLVHRPVHLPYLGLQQQAGPEVSEYCSFYGTPFQENSLPNKLSHLGEFLTGLTA